MQQKHKRYALAAISFIGLGFAAAIMSISTYDYLSLRSRLSLGPSLASINQIAIMGEYNYFIIMLSTMPVIAFSILLLRRSVFNRPWKKEPSNRKR